MGRNSSHLAAVAFLLLSLPTSRSVAQEFDIPLRINMGGPEITDDQGIVWLGDEAGPGDILDIRPNDAGGTNTISEGGWCFPSAESLKAAELDPFDFGIVSVMSSIRWDTGGDGTDFIIELPVPNSTYKVNLYFCEACCDHRHFQIAFQGEVVEENVSRATYAEFQGDVGVLSFRRIIVNDGILQIGLLPCPQCDCPECVGGTVIDINAIITAIEVVTDEECTQQDFGLACAYDPETDRVTATWNTVDGAEGYRVLKNGEQLFELPSNATSFTDANPRDGGNIVEYTLQALDGGVVFAECACVVETRVCPRGLACDFDGAAGTASLSWSGPVGFNVTGYEVRANGVVLDNLDSTATSFEHTPQERFVTYEVMPITDPADQCRTLSCTIEVTTILLEVPFRVNSGGPEVVDSLGRTWLGDQGAGVDPLMIRPDDAGGANTIEAWCNPTAATVEAVGFDPDDPNDVTLFRSIRWDTGSDANEYVIELPVANDTYAVNMYFCEACCDNRHFKIELQGQVVAEDVHRAAYAEAFHEVGLLSFAGIEVEDQLLTMRLFGCPDPECPGGVDINAILSAFEVLPSEFDPCKNPDFRQCPANLTCSVEGGTVTASWRPPQCFDVEGYEVFKDGVKLRVLPGDATSFTDDVGTRLATYEVVPLVAEGDEPCRPMSCLAVDETQPFDIPVRINMGGQGVVDSQGRRWLPDAGAQADLLRIRPDPIGGVNAIQNWCDRWPLSNFDSLQSMGFDPFHPGDIHILDTIRWDVGDDDGDLFIGEVDDTDGGDVDFLIELPVPNGEYLVNLYFTECCCPDRHFQVEIQDELVLEDVHNGIYSASQEFGRTGRFSFEDVVVEDGTLRIALRPCLGCPGVTDYNAIINAVEVLPNSAPEPRCPRDLACFLGVDGVVQGSWMGPEGMAVTGYELLRNGESIDVLGADETTFVDEPACTRITIYELVPQIQGGSPCPDLRLMCHVVDPFCDFVAPVRVNMGGAETLDSRGEFWAGDPGEATDLLEMRPDDFGGQHAPEFWSAGAFQPDSLEPIGFDPEHQGDRYIFNTIRWDEGANPPDFIMELPIADGVYMVNMYFNEGCCPDRHFQIEIQGEIVEEDVSFLDYVLEDPALGKAGVISFPEVQVTNDLLVISLLPCGDPLCPGSTDVNAIIDGLEILGEGKPPVEQFRRGDTDINGRMELTDAIGVFNFLFITGVPPLCFDAADADDNSAIELTDGIRILNVLFLGFGEIPPPGFMSCGGDPTADNFPVCVYPGCP